MHSVEMDYVTALRKKNILKILENQKFEKFLKFVNHSSVPNMKEQAKAVSFQCLIN